MIFLFETWVDTFSKNNYWEDIIIWHAKQTLFVFKNWKDCARTLILGEKQPKSAHFLQAKMVELKEAKKWIFCSSGKYWLTFWWYASLLSGSTIWEIERERLKSWGKGWGFFGLMVLKTQKSSFFLVSNIGFFRATFRSRWWWLLFLRLAPSSLVPGLPSTPRDTPYL